MSTELPLSRTMTFVYGMPRKVAPGVWRIVANNPSPLTFKGTNTYLVGEASLAVIDPGPDDGAHVDAIMAAAGNRPITHLLLTHAHKDHSGAMAALQARTGAVTCAFRPVDTARGVAVDDPRNKFFVDLGFVPDRPLADGESVAGDGWRLSAIATPGHAPDHLCFALDDDGIVFCGDHVMGWNTTVIAPPEGNMRDYYRSLERLLERQDRLFLSGHGEVIKQPQRLVKAYLMHRRSREAAIEELIAAGTGTIPAIVAALYRGVDGATAAAAALSVLAHIEHSIERGRVSCEGKPQLRSVFSYSS